MFLTAEELMAGGSLNYETEIPAEILHPMPDGQPVGDSKSKKIKIRPLTIKDIQLIAKAARDDEALTSVLMIQKALIEPRLGKSDIVNMHSGLVRFLIDRINQISGLHTTDDQMREMAASPLMQAFFILAKEFKWAPEQIKEMTVGQILGYLEMLNQSSTGFQP